MRARFTLVLLSAAILLGCTPTTTPPAAPATPAESSESVSGTVASRDGVPIAYTATGDGELALVFIHGGYADQSFWDPQVDAFRDEYRVVTLDLAAHGASGKGRESWSIDAFAADVSAVLATLELDAVILVGNSLGGPVALAAAAENPGVVRGVIAVDTLHDVRRILPREQLEAYVEQLRGDFPGMCKEMVKALLLEGTDPALYASIEERMCSFDPVLGADVVASFFDYDFEESFRAAEVPIRAIFGEINPVNLAGNRELQPDFDAVVLEGCGHYPQLEDPEAFNGALTRFVEEMVPRP